MTTTSIILLTIAIAVLIALIVIAVVFMAIGKAADQLEPYQEYYHEAEPPDEKE